jgi:dTDP-4-amino-4,6-dideoxygalactose transaminase
MIEYERLGDFNRSFFEDFKKVFDKFLESGWYILGKNVAEFEQQFSRYVGCGHCIGVGSGFDAIKLSLKVFDFKPGSEVIMPSNAYIATVFAALHCGLKVVFVEPDIRTYNMDPEKIEEKVTPRTVAILVVHLYGKSCNMGPIMETVNRFNLKLIEDCAQSHGAMFKNKKTGSFGDFGAFSFYPTKNLGALGDAGAITTNNDAWAGTLKRLRNYGSEAKNYFDVVGFNSRLDELQAAFLTVKLKKLDEINSHKRGLAKIYLDGLKEDFIKPVVDEDFYDVYHIFNIRHPKRDALKEYLKNNGVETQIHYPVPPHKQKAIADITGDDDCFPVSEEIHDTTLSLPISFYHSEEDIHRVVEVMNKF